MNAFLRGTLQDLSPQQRDTLQRLFVRLFEGSGSPLDGAYQASVARRNTEIENRLRALEARADDTAALEGQVADLQAQINAMMSRLEALEGE